MIIVLTTTGKKADAAKLARLLVSKKLAACVNIIKIQSSVYSWKGKVKESGEYLLLIKSKNGQYGKIERFLKGNHPYDLPEIVSLPAGRVYGRYLSWIGKSAR